ncbi:MAG: LacI family DNA-binding transcriptional regulator [Planctomycetota bacterium]
MATLQDIADAVGVTRMTASRVLNSAYTPKRSDGVRRAEEIRRVAEQLGYRPNTAAQSTRTGRFNCVAMLTPLSSGGFLPPALLIGIDIAMQKANLHLLMSDLPPDLEQRAEAAPKFLRELLADGLLVHYDPERIPDTLVSLLAEQQVPTIWLNADREFDTVSPDDRQGGRRATKMLLEAGAKRVLMINHDGDHMRQHVSVAQRQEGYAAAVRDAGFEPRVICCTTPMNDMEKFAELVALMKSPDRPDAVYGYEVGMGSLAMNAALAAGLRIPEDIKFIVTSDSSLTKTGLALTTLQVPFGEVGERGLDMLCRKVAQPHLPIPSERCPFFRVERGATL